MDDLHGLDENESQVDLISELTQHLRAVLRDPDATPRLKMDASDQLSKIASKTNEIGDQIHRLPRDVLQTETAILRKELGLTDM